MSMFVLTVERGSLAIHKFLSQAWALHSPDRSHCPVTLQSEHQHTPVQPFALLGHTSHCTPQPWCGAWPGAAPERKER